MGVVAAVMGLVKLPRGRAAAIADVRASSAVLADLPARLRELGFLDGEEIEVLATTGLSGGPLAVRVGETTFALRVREAECVTVRAIPS
jgi:ferrous iron transport protein A